MQFGHARSRHHGRMPGGAGRILDRGWLPEAAPNQARDAAVGLACGLSARELAAGLLPAARWRWSDRRLRESMFAIDLELDDAPEFRQARQIICAVERSDHSG